MQEILEEIAEYRRDADSCQKLSLDASGLECKRLLREAAALLTTLASELEARLEQGSAVSIRR